MKKLTMIFAALAVLVSTACVDHPNEPSETAEVTTAALLMEELEFHWFYVSYTEYEPESVDTLNLFLDVFDVEQDTAVIFMTPDCPCSFELHEAPKMVKLLEIAGVPTNEVEVLVMDKIDVSHKYEDRVTISDNPTIVVFRNGSPIYIPDAPEASSLEAVLWKKLR